MIVREIYARNILSKSKISDYTINPYTGCQHGCIYCYARFMKRFSGHKEPWGQFVDVKINAPDLLLEEIKRKPAGRVWISGVCDPYQPLEKRYGVTKKCLEILLQNGWPITVQTKSVLVLRDIGLIKDYNNIEVGITVTTGDEEIRQLFEPNSPPIKERIEALDELHLAGIITYAMIAPMLPRVKDLALRLIGKVNYVLIDRMNYHYSDWVYKKHNLEITKGDDFFLQNSKELSSAFERAGIDCQVLF